MKMLFCSQDPLVQELVEGLAHPDLQLTDSAELVADLIGEQRLLLFLDLDFERKELEALNDELVEDPNIIRIWITQKLKLKELKKHQKSDNAAHGYVRKPLTAEMLQAILNDFELSDYISENELTEEGTILESVPQTDIGADNFSPPAAVEEVSESGVSEMKMDTQVKKTLDSHNSSKDAPYHSVTNEDIQAKFDMVFKSGGVLGSADDFDDDDLDLNGEVDNGVETPEAPGDINLDLGTNAGTDLGDFDIEVGDDDSDDGEIDLLGAEEETPDALEEDIGDRTSADIKMIPDDNIEAGESEEGDTGEFDLAGAQEALAAEEIEEIEEIAEIEESAAPAVSAEEVGLGDLDLSDDGADDDALDLGATDEVSESIDIEDNDTIDLENEASEVEVEEDILATEETPIEEVEMTDEKDDLLDSELDVEIEEEETLEEDVLEFDTSAEAEQPEEATDSGLDFAMPSEEDAGEDLAMATESTADSADAEGGFDLGGDDDLDLGDDDGALDLGGDDLDAEPSAALDLGDDEDDDILLEAQEDGTPTATDAPINLDEGTSTDEIDLQAGAEASGEIENALSDIVAPEAEEVTGTDTDILEAADEGLDLGEETDSALDFGSGDDLEESAETDMAEVEEGTQPTMVMTGDISGDAEDDDELEDFEQVTPADMHDPLGTGQKELDNEELDALGDEPEALDFGGVEDSNQPEEAAPVAAAPVVPEEKPVEKEVETSPPTSSAEDRLAINQHHDGELIRLQATIRQLREEREELLKEVHEIKTDSKLLQQENLGLRADLEETKIEVNILKKRHHSEVDEVKYQLKISDQKKEIADEKTKRYQKEFDRLNQKVRIDFKKVQEREKELESQLELVTMDSAAQVKSRDLKILELKRKIDSLEFNMENSSIREQKSRDDKEKVEERLSKIMKTLRGSLKLLEDDLDIDEELLEKLSKLD
jgi:hypothetical protein